MNAYRRDLLWHSWVVHACLAELGAQASVDLSDFTLDVKAHNRYFKFYPRFYCRQGEQAYYTAMPNMNVLSFSGWLPYVNKRWSTGAGKFAFKDFCLAQGLPTPPMWRRGESGMREFVVKSDQSSFGKGMRGPFAAYAPSDPRQTLAPDGYYERFIRGRVIKAWFWEERLVSLESFDMPVVTGDGKSSLYTLIERACRSSRAPEWERHKDVADYQGLSLDAVPGAGQSVLADFRYDSNLAQMVFDAGESLQRFRGAAWLPRIAELGKPCWLGIPEPLRPATLFTLDAVIDAEDKPWLLEMNCNPSVHPEAYPAMFERLFGVQPRSLGAKSPETAFSMPPQSALPAPAVMRPAANVPSSSYPPARVM